MAVHRWGEMTSDGHDTSPSTNLAIAIPAEPNEGRKRGRIDALARQRLGLSLRLYYADIRDQPLPERFTQLLEKLSHPSSDEEDA